MCENLRSDKAFTVGGLTLPYRICCPYAAVKFVAEQHEPQNAFFSLEQQTAAYSRNRSRSPLILSS